MNYLDYLLIILLVVAIWAVIELALVFKRTRRSVAALTKEVNQTIDQIQPVIDKVDGIIDDLQPAIKQVDPIVGEAKLTVLEANESLKKVNGILQDVSNVSSTASDVSDAAVHAANSVASATTGFVNRILGKKDPAGDKGALGEEAPATAALHSADINAAAAASSQDDTDGEGYVTYSQTSADKDATTQATPAAQERTAQDTQDTTSIAGIPAVQVKSSAKHISTQS